MQSAVLFCSDFFAAMNVTGECVWGGVTEGRGVQEFPLTWLILYLLCSFAEFPPPTHGKGDGLFVKNFALRAVDAVLVYETLGSSTLRIIWSLVGQTPLSPFIRLSGATFAFIFSQNPSSLKSRAM